MNQIILGDCLERLRSLPDCSVDSCVTDPPYGLGTKEPTVQEIIEYLQGAELDQGGDFMGRSWNVPSVAVWKEVFRVLKPGGHVLSFGGTRTFDLISLGLRAAGFENRDTIASQVGVAVLEWVQGQGFPKSTNIEKALVKQGISGAAEFEGFGTALKPSWEPILVFRKPITESTVAKQVLATRTGALNIDGCRVGTATGRWPSNLVMIHSSGCKRVGTKRVEAPVINRFTDGMKPFGDGAGHGYKSEQRGDADGKEEISVYECVEGCPVKMLDGQSGERSVSGSARQGKATSGSSENSFVGKASDQEYVAPNDSGTASRFFPQFEQLESPFMYQAKISKAERDRGLPKGTNKHPTVKPIALMRWLVRLVTPKGGTVLDPYCGSGSTLVAAVQEGFGYVGIERDPEFHRVAEMRTTPTQSVFDLMDSVP